MITVSPFTILIDTHEVKPWKFQKIPGLKGQGNIVVPREWKSLGIGQGDYTIKGCVGEAGRWRVSIERKSLQDLYATILTRRRQFERELETLNCMEYAAVVVEANLSQVFSYQMPHWDEQKVPLEKRMARQRSVVGSIQAWQLRFPVVRWWFLPRYLNKLGEKGKKIKVPFAEVWVYRLLYRFWEDQVKEK